MKTTGTSILALTVLLLAILLIGQPPVAACDTGDTEDPCDDGDGNVIDLEGLAAGTVVGSISAGLGMSGEPVSGSVSVSATRNAGIVFDATCPAGCSGGDNDLEKPELGNVLIIAENLEDIDGDDLVDDPDDDASGGSLSFDFSGFGSGEVAVVSIDVLDVEHQGTIMLFSGGENGTLLATMPIPETGNNGLGTVSIDRSGVDFMVVTLFGSGAIDNFRVLPSAERDDGDNRAFDGLWRGVDPSDGGIQAWSISDGGKRVLLSDTYLRACLGGRATIIGEGDIDDGSLVAPMTIQCLTDPDNLPDGDPIIVEFIFTEVADGNLEVTTLPIDPLQQPTILHKVSRDDGDSKAFDGLWRGVDPSDGGIQGWSISDEGRRVLLSDTYLRACLGGRATIIGEGDINDGNLVAPMTIQCLTDPDNLPDGDPVIVEFIFTEVAAGNLEVTTLPIDPLQQPTILHKVSND